VAVSPGLADGGQDNLLGRPEDFLGLVGVLRDLGPAVIGTRQRQESRDDHEQAGQQTHHHQ